MKHEVSFAWAPYRLLPYEKQLGKREVIALTGTRTLGDVDGALVARVQRIQTSALKRVTYFSRVAGVGLLVEPLQARLECSANGAKTREMKSGNAPGLRRRQSTRYSAHGIHEYRGKFNPQVVRALCNMLGLDTGAWVLDPFCGSGTTLLECAHMGICAVGGDVNPLAVLIARTKLRAIRHDPHVLQAQVARLLGAVRRQTEAIGFERAFRASELRVLRSPVSRPLPNEEYLSRWFLPDVLAQMAFLQATLTGLEDKVVADLGRVVLSDCLRTVSLQDPGDLRIRRRKDPAKNYPLIPSFGAALERRVASILAARRVVGRVRGTQRVYLTDSRDCDWSRVSNGRGKFDAVISSPPYATALPYIDTQRLSLTFLDLVDSDVIAKLDRRLVGSREITSSERSTLEKKCRTGEGNLPDSVWSLVGTVVEMLRSGENGFRRQNMPALLHRYFTDMAHVLMNAASAVRTGGWMALVVGSNTTTIGGKQLRIDTPALLADIGSVCGWTPDDVIPLQAYQRYDVHQRNSIRTETLLLMRRA